MARLFISYARRDGEALARQLEVDLRAAGHEPWRDKREIGAGDAWSREIEDAINACEALIAVLTQGAFESSICRGEQLRALRLGRRIVPLLAQVNADRPIYLEGAHYLDFCDPVQYTQRLAELGEHLARGGGTDRDHLSPRARLLIESDAALGAAVNAATAIGVGVADWPALHDRAAVAFARWSDMLAPRGSTLAVYDRALYVERTAEEVELQRFGDGTKVGLLLVGASGMGKTNLIAHWSEQRMAVGDAVLVYPGDQVDAQRWPGEMARDLGLEDAAALEPFWPRLEAVLQAAGRRLWIVVDGLNDVRAGADGARALLMAVDALVSRLPGSAVRVLASCTLGSWQRMDRQEPLRLAWRRYHQPADSDVMLLDRFDAGQAAEAFERYAAHFGLKLVLADLPPAFRARMAEPGLLRLLADCLQAEPTPDPAADFDTRLFRRYWEQHLRRRDQQSLADELAAEMLAQRSAALPMTPLLQHPTLGPLLADAAPDSAYVQLLDDGVLTEVGGRDLFEDARLRFTYPQIGAYAIVRTLLRRTPEVAATVRALAAMADELPLAWEAAVTLMTLRGDEATFGALAGDADAELRELALESLVRHHGADPVRGHQRLAALLESGTREQQRTALRAAFNIGPAARDLLVSAALSRSDSLRGAVRDTLYFIWTGATRPEGETRSSAMYFVWQRAPDFTRALMQELAARLSWLRPWETTRIFAFLLDLSITIYVNHCDRPDVVEQTADLFHRITVEQLHIDRLLTGPTERLVVGVVKTTFARRLLQWMMLDGRSDGAGFFDTSDGTREAVGRAAAWIDPASDLAAAVADLRRLLSSPVAVCRGVGALVVAVHAVADPTRTEPVVRQLFDALDEPGRSWLLAAHAVLLPTTPPQWVGLLESLTSRLQTAAPGADGPPPLLRFFDALYVPLGLAYAKRGVGMPLFDPLLAQAQRQPLRAGRLISALGVVGFYHPQAVLQYLRPSLPTLLREGTTAPAILAALATMRTLHFEAVDAALVQADGTEAQRRDVAALADPERVQQFMRLLGYYNNAVHYCVHYPRMRRGLGGSALQLLATATGPREFIAGYASQAMRMARDAGFDLRQWTRPDEPGTAGPAAITRPRAGGD